MTLARRVQGMEQVVALAEAGSFVAAGRRLGVSPSALGKAIAATEERLDARLFHRTTRSVALTEEGALYLDHCRRVLSEVDDAEAALARSAEGVAGTIRLGAPSAYGRLRIVPPLARFLAAHPEARVDLRLADRVLDPLEERLDLVVRIGRLADSGMRAWEIDHVRIGLFVHPDRLATTPIGTPDDLAAHPLMLFETPDGRLLRPELHDEVDHLLDVSPILVSTDAEAVVAAAEARAGVCYVPTFLAEPAVARGTLVAVLPDHAVDHAPVHILAPRPERIPRRVQALVRCLRTEG